MNLLWQPREPKRPSTRLLLTANPASHQLLLLKWLSRSFIWEAALKLLAALLAYQTSLGGHLERRPPSVSAQRPAAAAAAAAAPEMRCQP